MDLFPFLVIVFFVTLFLLILRDMEAGRRQ